MCRPRPFRGAGLFQMIHLWTQTLFRFSSIRFSVSAIRSIRSASVFLFFLVLLLPFFSVRADEVEVLEPFEYSPEVLTAVTNLARSVSGVNASQATVDDNVAAILALLQGISFSWAIKSYPYANQNNTLWQVISRNINEYPNVVPSGQSTSSYFYEIQRALYGKSGVPSSSLAIQPLLLALSQRDFASNVWARADIDGLLSDTNVWTRADIDRLLSTSNVWSSVSVSSLLDYVNSIDSSVYSLDSSLNDVDSLLNNLYSMYGSVYDLNLFRHPSFRVEDEILKNIYQSRAKDASPDDSAIRVVDPYTHDAIDALMTELAKLTESITNQVNSADSSTNLVAISGALSALLEDVDDVLDQMDLYFPQYLDYWYQLLYYNLGYHLRAGDTIASDLLDLRRQLGVESPSRTNNIFHTLQRFFDDSESMQLVSSTGALIKSEIQAAENSAQSVIASSSNEVARIAEDEEPDWDEHRYTGSNPFDAGDNIFDLPQRQANSVFLSLPESQHKEIVLFRGNFPIFGGSASRSQSNVPLNISYPLTDYDAVSGGLGTMRDIMEWVWSWVALCINVLMLFRFYQSLARSAIGAEQGSFNE